MEFDPVSPEDFTTFKPGVVATHVKIEQLLTTIGGGGTAGTEYKNNIIKKAGWKYDPIIGFAKNPGMAADVFNKLRGIIVETQDKEDILNRVES